MLANCLAVPSNEAEWSIFSFNNRDEIDRINAAILAQYDVNLPTYDVDPINFNDIYTFLLNNSQAHTAFNSILNLTSNDLLGVDLRDIKQRSGWVWLNYSELRDAEAALQI
jgi:hypothetical protein